nr:MAG TPA: hypothetical protein [Caudoviricetes sp.]
MFLPTMIQPALLSALLPLCIRIPSNPLTLSNLGILPLQKLL